MKQMFFWNSLALSMIQQMLGVWSLVPLPFLKPAWTSGTVYVLLKPGLENFEHYFTSVWDKCNCAVVWAFFGIAFLWDWNENWPFPVLCYINTLKKLQVLKKTKPKTRMVTWPKSFKVKWITMKYLFSSCWKIVDCFTTILKFGIPLITCLIFL